MPETWSNAEDSPSVYDQCASFAGGQFSYAKPREIGPDQAELLQDVEVSITGAAISRRGTDYVGGATDMGGTLIQGLLYFKTPSVAYEIAVSNAKIYHLVGSMWSPMGVKGDIPDATSQVGMVQGIDKFIVSDTLDTWQWTDPVTWLQLNDVGGAASTNKAPTGASLCAWFTNRLILAGPAIENESGSIVSDAIYLSNFLDATTWDDVAHGGAATKDGAQIRVGAGDGSPIFCIVPWNNFSLAVFKRHKTYVVTVDPTLAIADMPAQQVHGTIGCIAPRTAIQVGADIFFLAEDGVRSLNYSIASDQRHEIGIPMSFPVQDVIQRINWQYANTACAVLWKNLYIISLPVDGSTTPNVILTYNINSEKWNSTWSNLPVSSFAVREVNGVSHLMMGLSTASSVIEYLDFVHESDAVDSTFTDYNDAYVLPRIKTRAMTFSEGVSNKKGLGTEFEFNNSKGIATATPILDENTVANASFILNSGGIKIPVQIPVQITRNGINRVNSDLMQFNEFRELQYDITTFGIGRKELRQVTSAAIVQPSMIGFGSNIVLDQIDTFPGSFVFSSPGSVTLSFPQPVQTGKAYTIDLACISGTSMLGYVDGLAQPSLGTFPSTTLSRATIGALDTVNDVNNVTIASVQIGTTAIGSNDLLDTDFSDGLIVPPFTSQNGPGLYFVDGLNVFNAGSNAYGQLVLSSPTSVYVRIVVTINHPSSTAKIITISNSGFTRKLQVGWQPAPGVQD